MHSLTVVQQNDAKVTAVEFRYAAPPSESAVSLCHFAHRIRNRADDPLVPNDRAVRTQTYRLEVVSDLHLGKLTAAADSTPPPTTRPLGRHDPIARPLLEDHCCARRVRPARRRDCLLHRLVTAPYLEGTNRQGRILAAYYYLSRATTAKSVHTRCIESGMVIDLPLMTRRSASKSPHHFS